jgi:hypothetical protein
VSDSGHRAVNAGTGAPDSEQVLIGFLLLLGFAAVPLRGGRLGALLEVRVRHVWLVACAFAVQILIVNVLPGVGSEGLHSVVHVATYVAIAVAVTANLRLPGFALIAVGGACNALVIAANGGVMPSSASALRFAGMELDPAGFTNSSHIAHPHLGFLGDVMAVPSWVPAANVFSIGDLLLVAGAWVLVHRVCVRRELAVRFFEQVAAGPRSVLLRLGADAPADLELVVDDGRAHRLAPLPAAPGVAVVAFAAPAALLGPRTVFAAAVGGRLVDLPAPRVR